jgi:hypothetical protein
MASPTAGCPRGCDTPLVMTMAFRGKEFYCLDCGRLYEFLEPRRLDTTPEVDAAQKAAGAEFTNLTQGDLLPTHLAEIEPDGPRLDAHRTALDRLHARVRA